MAFHDFYVIWGILVGISKEFWLNVTELQFSQKTLAEVNSWQAPGHWGLSRERYCQNRYF